jgi:hypothetical protein
MLPGEEGYQQLRAWLEAKTMIEELERSAGALIGYVQTPVLASIGYLELWPEHHALFFNEVGDSSTGQQHIVRFDRMTVRGTQAILYQDGAVMASIAPFDEWPGQDLDRLKATWREWQSDQGRRRPLDIENAKGIPRIISSVGQRDRRCSPGWKQSPGFLVFQNHFRELESCDRCDLAGHFANAAE